MPASRSVLAATAGEVHFTASGDFAAGTQTTAVLNQIKTIATRSAPRSRRPVVRDDRSGTNMVRLRPCALIGATFPFELVSRQPRKQRNQNGNINDFSACMPNQLPGVVGTTAANGMSMYRRTNPIAQICHDLAECLGFHHSWPTGPTLQDDQSLRLDVQTAIDSARTKSIPWVIVGMHKPCLSLGEYALRARNRYLQPAHGQEGGPGTDGSRTPVPENSSAGQVRRMRVNRSGHLRCERVHC